MELFELKQQWKKTGSLPTTHNHNIMEMIRHNSNGPVAVLKQSYRRQAAIMLVLPIAMTLINLSNIGSALSSVLFWTYVAFCVAVAIYAGYNYRVVATLDETDSMVKQHLEKTIAVLETRMRQNVTGVKIALLIFIVLTEVLPYIQHFPTLDYWHGLSPFIRFGAYALLILSQHFSLRRMSYLKFGQHIERLKELVRQME
ncbi:MAG: hypothetical protein JWQ30_897 [Sediminibacterium sp.]|nr:hypothetical protein [Sediminibacterium sp.]